MGEGSPPLTIASSSGELTGENKVKGEDLGERRTVLPVGHDLLSLTEGWKTLSMVTGSRPVQGCKQLDGSKNWKLQHLITLFFFFYVLLCGFR